MDKLDETIKASEVVCGDFTITCLGGSSMLIEKKCRQQALTLEEGEAKFLVDNLLTIVDIFETDYRRRQCLYCWRWHGNDKKYCPLKGNVGSDFYCKKFEPRENRPKNIPKEEDGDGE